MLSLMRIRAWLLLLLCCWHCCYLGSSGSAAAALPTEAQREDRSSTNVEVNTPAAAAADASTKPTASVSFGRALLKYTPKKHFLQDDNALPIHNNDNFPKGRSGGGGGFFLLNYTNFNHGSFGACPQPVLDYQTSLRKQQEQQPDPFIRQHYKQLWNDTRVRIAASNSFRVPYQQLVLVESASTAVNSILRSIEWKQGDCILYFSTAYGMVKNTAQWLQQHYQLEIVEVPIEFPILDGDDAYLVPLRKALEAMKTNGGDNPRPPRIDRLKVAVLDHIVSIPAIKLPVQKMTQMIRQYGSSSSTSPFILVDGAHAWGQVPALEISDLLQGDKQTADSRSHIDAYLSNGHKWMYSPKGSAVLWVHPSRITQTFPEPTVISSENSMPHCSSSLFGECDNSGDNDDGDDPLYHRFIYTSTKDYTALLSLSAAMDFRDDVLGGDDAIYTYIHELAMQAKAYLMRLWDTPIPMAPNEMEEYMINVILPISKNDKDKKEIGLALQRYLYDTYDMYVVIAEEPSSGLIYTRLSAQVYLEMSDFERLGKAVLAFLGPKKNLGGEIVRR